MTTAGVHPHNAKDWDAAALARLRELAAGAAATLAAIGECGLDYNRNFSPPQAQRQCFEDQLALAAQLGKPVFLHERDAFDDFVSILKKYRANLPGAVVHCFTGGAAELEAYLELDCYIGITGWICDERRGAHLVPLLPRIPADRLLLETDAPYLLPRNLPGNLPRSVRGKSGRNEPCFLPHIAACVAAIAGKPPQQLAEETGANARRLFTSLPAA
jgi:TatD DNase family protein